MGQIIDPVVTKVLGHLQIQERPAPNVYQSIHFFTFTTSERTERAHLGRMLKQMTLAGRSMIRR
jgi:hypothetical protein